MTTYFELPSSGLVSPAHLEVRLCAEGEVMSLERIPFDDPVDVIDVVLSRFGIPRAVLRDETQPGLPPVGWVAEAPPSLATSGRVVETPFGPIRTPDAHVELIPVFDVDDGASEPRLSLTEPSLAKPLAAAGLLDSADASVPQLWDGYRAASVGTGDPAARFDSLLSVHTRARSAGTMLLAAHAADSLGFLLHRCGSFDAASAMHRWALGVYARGQHEQDRAIALINLAHVLWHDDRPEPAVEAGRLALDITAEHGTAHDREWARQTTAHALVAVGRPGEALALLGRAAAPSDPRTAGWLAQARGTARLALGDHDGARSDVRAALAAAARVDDPGDAASLRAEVHDLAAAVGTATGQVDRARHATALADEARAQLPAPLVH